MLTTKICTMRNIDNKKIKCPSKKKVAKVALNFGEILTSDLSIISPLSNETSLCDTGDNGSVLIPFLYCVLL